MCYLQNVRALQTEKCAAVSGRKGRAHLYMMTPQLGLRDHAWLHQTPTSITASQRFDVRASKRRRYLESVVSAVKEFDMLTAEFAASGDAVAPL